MTDFTMALKHAITESKMTLPAIADASRVDKGQLSRFMASKRTLTLATADRILRGLSLEVRLAQTKGGSKR